MYVIKGKTTKGSVYYLAQSFVDPVTKKNSSKTIERIGTEEEIKKRIGNKDLKKWLSDYAKKKTKEQNKNKNIELKFPSNKKISDNQVLNAGYLILKKCCEDIGLHTICNRIQKKEGLDFSLFDILSCMIYNKYMSESRAISTYVFSQSLIGNFNFCADDIKTAIKVFYKYSTEIQKFINKRIPGDSDSVFYECLNYDNIILKNSAANIFSELNNNKLIAKLYYKNNGMLIGYSLIDQDGRFINTDDYVYRKYAHTTLYETADSIALPKHDQKLKIFKNAIKINNQNFSNFDKELQDWILDPNDWISLSDDKTYNLKELSEKILTSTEDNNDLYSYIGAIFYKKRNVTITNTKTNKKIKKNLFVIFSFEMRLWLQEKRNTYIENIKKIVEGEINRKNKAKDFYKKYNNLIKEFDVDEDKNYYIFDDQKIQNQGKFDGYKAYCEDVDNDTLMTLLQVSYRNEFIDSQFYNNINRELLYTPGLSVRENLNTHFLVSYLTNNINAMINSKLDYKYWYYHIQQAICNMSFYRVKNQGWIPLFDSNKLIDDLNNTFDTNICNQFFTDAEIHKLIS